MIIQSRRPAKPAYSAPTPLTPEAEPPPRPTLRFNQGVLRQRERGRTPYPDRDNGPRSRRDCASNTNTGRKRATFERRLTAETVEPCPRRARPPDSSCAPGDSECSEDPEYMDARSRAEVQKTNPRAFAPINLTTCFSSGRGWRGPCFARTVTTVTICCKQRLCIRSETPTSDS